MKPEFKILPTGAVPRTMGPASFKKRFEYAIAHESSVQRGYVFFSLQSEGGNKVRVHVNGVPTAVCLPLKSGWVTGSDAWFEEEYKPRKQYRKPTDNPVSLAAYDRKRARAAQNALDEVIEQVSLSEDQIEDLTN